MSAQRPFFVLTKNTETGATAQLGAYGWNVARGVAARYSREEHKVAGVVTEVA